MKLPFGIELFGEASTRAPATAPYEAIKESADYLCIATTDAEGKRLREKDARTAVRVLDSLIPEGWRP